MKLKDTNMKHNICEETEILIEGYLDGMIPAEDKLKMEQHLAACYSCRKYLENTVILLEKAALLSGNDDLSKEKQAELWDKIEAKINSASLPKSDTRVYNMSGLEDESAQTKGSSPGAWGSIRYYISGLAAVLILAFVVYGVNKFLKRDNNIDFTNNIVEVNAPKWMVTSVRGNPMINNMVMKAIDSLAVGGYITTDGESKAELYVAGLGSVIIEPNSRVKLIKSADGNQRISLEYGSIDANILAKPRTFFVEAGSITAVDLGCSYKFSIDKSGDGLLYVRSGRVSLESENGRESIVPEGKFCVTKQNVGPGTPFRQDSSPQLKQALMDFDFGTCGSECVNTILRTAKKTDAVTLVNIIPRIEEQYKTRVYDRVASFCPPPKNIPTDSIPRLKKLENLNEWVDKIMDEVHMNIEENMKMVEEQMKQFNEEKWQKEWDKNWGKNWDKNVKKNWNFYYLPNGEDTIIIHDGNFPSLEEMQELNEDLQDLQKDLKFDSEEFKREMEKVKEEMSRVNEEIRREMEESQREVGKEQLKKEKEDLKKQKEELKKEKEQRKLEKKDREKQNNDNDIDNDKDN